MNACNTRLYAPIIKDFKVRAIKEASLSEINMSIIILK